MIYTLPCVDATEHCAFSAHMSVGQRACDMATEWIPHLASLLLDSDNEDGMPEPPWRVSYSEPSPHILACHESNPAAAQPDSTLSASMVPALCEMVPCKHVPRPYPSPWADESAGFPSRRVTALAHPPRLEGNRRTRPAVVGPPPINVAQIVNRMVPSIKIPAVFPHCKAVIQKQLDTGPLLFKVFGAYQ